MKFYQRFRWTIVMLSLYGIVCGPVVSVAETPIPLNSTVDDLTLSVNGELIGHVTNSSGQALVGAPVEIRGNGIQQQVVSDEQGVFRLQGLRGGVYQMSVAGQARVYRVWTANSAPPKAQQQALLITGQDVARGQMPISDIFCNPLVIGGILLAAIAIPVAVHNSGDDSSDGS